MRTNSWVWASTPGVTRTRTAGRSERPRRRLEQATQPGDLVEGVDHDAPHPVLESRGQLLFRLVVAVEDQLGGRHAGGEGDVELAP